MRKLLFPILLLGLLLSACNPSKHLSDGEYMLTKNSVKVVDKNRDILLDDLSYMVRPITNKKFLDVFPIRTSLYVNNLPKTDSAGNVIKDTKFMQKMRNALRIFCMNFVSLMTLPAESVFGKLLTYRLVRMGNTSKNFLLVMGRTM